MQKWHWKHYFMSWIFKCTDINTHTPSAVKCSLSFLCLHVNVLTGSVYWPFKCRLQRHVWVCHVIVGQLSEIQPHTVQLCVWGTRQTRYLMWRAGNKKKKKEKRKELQLNPSRWEKRVCFFSPRRRNTSALSHSKPASSAASHLAWLKLTWLVFLWMSSSRPDVS